MEPSHQGGSFVSISVRGKNVKAKQAQTPLEYTVNIKKVFSSLLDLTTLAVAAVLFVKKCDADENNYTLSTATVQHKLKSSI